MIKVAIVEDDSGLRASLAILVDGSEGLQCVGTYATAETALENLPRAWPDVVLMDINLPQMSGIECVARLKTLNPDLHFIMLTVYVDNDKIFKSLQSGASGYLIKQTAPAELLEAIADVQRGGAPMTNTIARRVVQYFQQRKPVNAAENLTPREQEILDLVAQGFRDKEIADKLSLSVRTVGTHIRNIYEKLHVHSRTEAVLKFLNK